MSRKHGKRPELLAHEFQLGEGKAAHHGKHDREEGVHHHDDDRILEILRQIDHLGRAL